MTIKQLADSIGVSKNTIKGRLKGIELIKNDKGVIELTEEQIQTVCEALKVEPPEPVRTTPEPLKTSQEPVKTSLNQFRTDGEPVTEPLKTTLEPPENQSEPKLTQDYIDSLNEQIVYLKKQIEDKDNTIKELNAEYKTLAEKMAAALVNAQTLNAIDKLPAPATETEAELESRATVEPHKTTLFKRLFKRR